MSAADEYNKAQLATGKLSAADITELVKFFQRERGLDDDGKFGPKTKLALDEQSGSRLLLPLDRCWPLRMLRDGRKPQITSGFRNPERKNHSGADLFYAYRDGDPAMKIGDGGRTKAWWIPEGTHAVSVASGTVELAGKLATGWRVWVRHEGGYATGYFHLTQLFVEPNQTVGAGQPLGVVGDNPIDNDADHLHFELVAGDLENRIPNLRDPMTILRGAAFLEAA